MRKMCICKLLLTGIAAIPLQSACGIQIAGSDLLEDIVRGAILEELDSAGMEAEISLEGSLLGISALESGDVDACIIAVPDGSGPVSAGDEYFFGFQIVAFAVNESNPLTEIDYTQLANLFRSNGSIDNWSALIPASEWQERKVNLWAARSEKNIALEIFNSVALRGSPLKDSIRYASLDREQLMRIVANDVSAVMIMPNIKPATGVRLLAVKADASSQSYTPSEDNVFYGDYPLRLPLKLVMNKDAGPGKVAALIRAVYSDRVTRALENAFYMPVPLTERQAVLSQFK